MKSYWSYIKGEDYDLACTGGSVSVFDRNGKEILIFKGLTNAIFAAFIPNTNKFIAKSTDGIIYVFSIDEAKLLKKFRFSKSGNQNYGFCFNYDGTILYVIENYNGLNTRIIAYETKDFTEVEKLFENAENRILTHMECFDDGNIILLGYVHNNGIVNSGFVGFFDGKRIYGLRRIDFSDFDFANAYKTLQIMGFTEKAKRWAPLPENRDVGEFSLTDLI